MAPLLKCSILILLGFFFFFFLTLVPGAEGKGSGLRRQKRAWIIAPRKLYENQDYTTYESIARIRSDMENFTKIFYFLSGPGVDMDPMGVFGINRDTGFVKIYSILDRENIPSYHLKGVAKFPNGSYAEKDIDLRITVLDRNDCPPVIKVQQVGYVNESSAAGTIVMKVIATDADEENTAHSRIHYSIVESSNIAGMFFINSQTGEVTVRQNTLDREKKDSYTLTIKVSDMDGQVGGFSGTSDITIKILDINDNMPTLEKESYEGKVEENTANVEVMRINSIDADLIHTDNWRALYKIVSGNEAGYFTITTDSKTNEGVIMCTKALDYEELKMLNLKVAVTNIAKYVGEHTTSKTYPVKINVINQKEGPKFLPSVKVIKVSEDHTYVSINKVIESYTAIDSDTRLIATNVRYAKIKDDDNWLSIDEKTAEIKLNKMPDRESTFLVNGTYYAKIICITTDSPSKTATGTIAIQVEDFNDHCPILTTTTHSMCIEDNVIYVTAVDKDEKPNSSPFHFTVIQGSNKGKWTVETLNETTAILRDQANLWPGKYKVEVKVEDQQGKSCDDVQIMDVTVCNCDDVTKNCNTRRIKTAGFGVSGILLLLLGLLLLLLLPLLLLFCLCGGAAAVGNFKDIPFDTKQQLIAYHTEGQGEDKEVPLLFAPVQVHPGTINTNTFNTLDAKGHFGEQTALGFAADGASALNNSTLTTNDMYTYGKYGHSGGQVEMDYIDGATTTRQDHLFSTYRAGAFDGMALSHQYLGEYYASKSSHAAQQYQQKDSLLVYDYEGQESLAGSVGCCSLLENDNDLAFLNDLDPKFKTLAEICQGSTLATESVDASILICPARPVSPVWPSTSTSTHTHVNTHTETIRDRDHVNINTLNTLNTSNVASGSSTVVQEELISQRATAPMLHVQDNIVVPSQTMLIQQPAMYYAATPMYVVESKPQMVLVAGGAQQTVGQVGQVGLSQGLVQVGGMQGGQGLVQVGGLQSGQGLVQVGGLQGGQGLVQVGGLQGSQGVVLVDRQVGVGGVTGQVAQGRSQGTLSRTTHVLVTENGSSGGVQGAHLAQGIVQAGHGSAEQGLEIRGQGLQFSLASHGSTGSNEDFAVTATPKSHGSQRVVVQRKKVSVTERNIDSRA